MKALKAVGILIVCLLVSQAAWAKYIVYTPEFPKYPDTLKKEQWDKQKSFALKVKAKIANLQGMGSAMKAAEDFYTNMLPKNEQYLVAGFDRVTKEDLAKQIQGEKLALFKQNVAALEGNLKAVKDKANEYISILGSDANFKDSRAYLNEIVADVDSYVKKVKAYDENKMVEEWIKGANREWNSSNGIAFIKPVLEDLRKIDGLNVATVADWKAQVDPLKKDTFLFKITIVDDNLRNMQTRWMKFQAPKADTEVAAKLTQFKALAAEIKAFIEPLGR